MGNYPTNFNSFVRLKSKHAWILETSVKCLGFNFLNSLRKTTKGKQKYWILSSIGQGKKNFQFKPLSWSSSSFCMAMSSSLLKNMKLRFMVRKLNIWPRTGVFCSVDFHTLGCCALHGGDIGGILYYLLTKVAMYKSCEHRTECDIIYITE